MCIIFDDALSSIEILGLGEPVVKFVFLYLRTTLNYIFIFIYRSHI